MTALVVADRASEWRRLKALVLDSEAFIARLNGMLAPESKRLGRRKVKAAIEELTRRIGEAAARSKQNVFQAALATISEPKVPSESNGAAEFAELEPANSEAIKAASAEENE